jgi:hypothetical protein
MRYTLLLHWPEMSVADVGEDDWKDGMAAFQDYAASLEEAGVLVSAEVLQPTSSSTTLVAENGTLRVQDGPYAETKDRLGGTIVIEVPDLDAALAWAEKCPSAQWGPIEIRPSAVRFADGAWVN